MKKIESEFVFEEEEVPEATDSSPPQHHDEPQPPSNSYASSVVPKIEKGVISIDCGWNMNSVVSDHSRFSLKKN